MTDCELSLGLVTRTLGRAQIETKLESWQEAWSDVGKLPWSLIDDNCLSIQDSVCEMAVRKANVSYPTSALSWTR